MVVNELRGEKIDVIPWNDDPAILVANALQPAKVKEARIDATSQTALVIVPDYQLSLAIGREGQNARLAARLTGWRIDIKSETQYADEQRAPRPAPTATPAAVAVEPAPEPDATPNEVAPPDEIPAPEVADAAAGDPIDGDGAPSA